MTSLESDQRRLPSVPLSSQLGQMASSRSPNSLSSVSSSTQGGAFPVSMPATMASNLFLLKEYMAPRAPSYLHLTAASACPSRSAFSISSPATPLSPSAPFVPSECSIPAVHQSPAPAASRSSLTGEAPI